jgi:hypothetical protein
MIGFAALGAVDQQVVGALDLDPLLPDVQEALARVAEWPRPIGRGGLQPLGGQQAGQHLANGQLAVANRREHVVGPDAHAQVLGEAFKLAPLPQQPLERKIVPLQLALQVFAADLLCLLFLGHVQVMADLGAGPIRDCNREPVPCGLVAR